MPPAPALQASAPNGVSAAAIAEATALVRANAEGLPAPVFGPGPDLLAEVDSRGLPYMHFDDWDAIGLDALNPVDAAPRELEVHDIHLRRLPWSEVDSDGRFRIRWESREEAPAGRAFWGVTIPGQVPPLPRYRKTAAESLPGNATLHAVEARLQRLEGRDYDVSGLVAEGGGVIHFRVEQYIPSRANARFFDGRFGYLREGESYRRAAIVSDGPFVDFPAANQRAVLSFETDAPTAAAIAVSWSAGDAVVDAGTGQRFEVELPALPPGETIRYRVLVADSAGVVVPAGDLSFDAPSSASAPLRFAVMSDSRSGAAPGEDAYWGNNLSTLRDHMSAALLAGAEMIVFPGDLIDGYTTATTDYVGQLAAWRHAVEPIAHYLPIYEGFGNHESLMRAFSNGVAYSRPDPDSAEALFGAAFVNPRNGPANEGEGTPAYGETVYSWDRGNAHFVMLNSNYWWSYPVDDDGRVRPLGLQNREGYVMDAQLAWLRADLAAARAAGVEHIFVFTHEPPFPNGRHADDAMWWNGHSEVVARRDELVRLLMEFGVLAIFTGDEHNYTRTLIDERVSADYPGRLWSIVSGGCGAPYYAMRPELPWAGNTEAFSAQQNYLLVDVDGGSVRLRAVGETGQVLDDIVLTER